jgi:hypothetical protein
VRPQLQDDDFAQYQNLLERVRKLELLLPEEVHFVGDTATGLGVEFANGWQNNDVAAGPVGRAACFYRDRGRTYLGGVIKSGTSATAAFYLPDGYRPLLQTPNTALAVVCASALGAVDTAIVNVDPASGSVTPLDTATSNVSNFVFLEGANFRSD